VDQAAKEGELYISSISVWEVALLAERGRLRLAMDVSEWIRYCEALPFLNFVPVNSRIALLQVTLGATLVSKDERILAYPHIDSLW